MAWVSNRTPCFISVYFNQYKRTCVTFVIKRCFKCQFYIEIKRHFFPVQSSFIFLRENKSASLKKDWLISAELNQVVACVALKTEPRPLKPSSSHSAIYFYSLLRCIDEVFWRKFLQMCSRHNVALFIVVLKRLQYIQIDRKHENDRVAFGIYGCEVSKTKYR